MNRDDIIRMAREAGLFDVYEGKRDKFERFAALVAAAEREACAGLAERRLLDDDNADRRIGHHHACKSIADAIRARGNP